MVEFSPKFALVDYLEKVILSKYDWSSVTIWAQSRGIKDPIEMCLQFYTEHFTRDNRANNVKGK